MFLLVYSPILLVVGIPKPQKWWVDDVETLGLYRYESVFVWIFQI